VEYGVIPDLHENFYAISVKRHFESPLLQALLTQPEADVLGRLLAGSGQ
jgi:LysR family transcriptional regulator, transcriptional activator of nhaA